VNLWGFGPEKKRDDPPTDDEIDAARQRVGYKKIEVRTEPPALRKFATDVYLDLSAVAKGYAVDQVSEALAQAGAHASMVEIGGEVVTRGTKPDGTPWRIGVERPDDTGRMVQLVLELGDRALATSGDYRNYFESQGRRYSHTIDPKTGRPVLHDLAQVSVEAGACMEADAVATALLVLGEQAGYDYCVAHDVAALLMIRRGEQIIERATPRFLQLHPDYEETR
jgi:thiamine biosynthesis lipoprotein